MVEQLTQLLGLTGEETPALTNLLTMYIANAQQEFLIKTGQTQVPQSAQYLIIQMAAINYNKQGSQGASSENHGGGVSIVWEKNYPTPILQGIANFTKIQW